MQIIRTKNSMITTSKRASEIVNEALRHLKRYCHYESKERFVQILRDGIRDYLVEYAEEKILFQKVCLN